MSSRSRFTYIFCLSLLFCTTSFAFPGATSIRHFFRICTPWVKRTPKDAAKVIGKRPSVVTVKFLRILGKIDRALPDEQIDDLARLARETGGLKKVGDILGNLPSLKNASLKLRHLVLEDAYLRIAIKNGKMSANAAQEVFEKLHNTKGLTALIRKINSTNVNQVKGHLQELNIALQAQRKHFKALSFGEKFADGLKKGDTDLDVLLQYGKKHFAIESKAYSHLVPPDMVRADAQSLLAYCQKSPDTIPVFCFSTPPSKFVQPFLQQNHITALVGNPEEIATKLAVLAQTL